MSKTILVKYQLDDPQAQLGSFAKVFIPLAADTTAIPTATIPRSYLRYEYGMSYVWVRDAVQLQAQKQTIQL
ncbi:MAG: hypothetical protein H6765_09210 [Candidatus Peribacteria bacterium]|nr:MAG: hypothetical protein H6765_09210 [Candidatus Peribacteria bacterium]